MDVPFPLGVLGNGAAPHSRGAAVCSRGWRGAGGSQLGDDCCLQSSKTNFLLRLRFPHSTWCATFAEGPLHFQAGQQSKGESLCGKALCGWHLCVSVQQCSCLGSAHDACLLSCPRTRLSVLLGVSGPVGGYTRAPLSYVVLQTYCGGVSVRRMC